MTEDNNNLASGILKIFKDSPALLVIILVVYIFTTTISNKLDTINNTLMEQQITNEILLERLEQEAKDTEKFISQQEDMNNKLELIIDILTGKWKEELIMANEAWKQAEVQKCLNRGILTDSSWLYKTDEKVTVWMVCAMFNHLIDEMEEGNIQYALV